MSEVTKILYRKNYPAIDAASPEQSQAGRKVLITGASAVIGRAAAQGFVPRKRLHVLRRSLKLLGMGTQKCLDTNMKLLTKFQSTHSGIT
jgi:hypothetical protein